MYWQQRKLYSGETFSVSSTYRRDLPEYGYLSSLMLQISGDQASDFAIGGGLWRIIDYITKVEVIANGSQVVKSLTGQQAQALAFYDQLIPALDTWRGYATNTQFCNILLNFGRRAYDPDYGLDLSKYDNVEVRVTTNATASQFTSGFSIDVTGIFQQPQEQVRTLGYLRSEIWRTWTTVQDAWQYFTLPIDYRLRRILLHAIPAYDSTAHTADTQFTNCLYDIQHFIKTGQVTVFDGRLADLVRMNAYDYGQYVITHPHAYVNADKAIPVGVGVPDAHIFQPASYSGSAETSIASLTAGQTADTVAFESGVGAGPDEGIVIGRGYHNTAVLRYDSDADPLTWLDMQSNKAVDLNIHTRNSSSADNATAAVVLDRLVQY